MIKRITLLNTISTLLLQLCNILSGFIIPKLILTAFGSEVNGLVSSLTQFLSYITLVEGGITGVVTASLYRPLTRYDDEKISSIVKTSQTFYRKISLIFIVYTIVLASIYPIIFSTNFSYAYVASLALILSISLIIQYMFSLAAKTLLSADKKIYIVSFTQAIILLVGIILAYISISILPSIHIFKFLTGIVFIIQPIIFKRYINKHYKINKKAKEDNKLIMNRWNGFAINIAAFIHGSTDITILTIFTSLTTVSVYSIYALVSTGLKTIINALVSSLNPVLGHAYAKKDYVELNKKMNLYEYIVFMLVSFLFSLAILLIVPFILIYTDGINDANYNQPAFAVLLLISEALYLIKFPHLNLAYSANRFKEISPTGFIEAAINIVISLSLVSSLGLIGVALGTVIAMFYRMAYHVWYTTKLIKGRKQCIFYSKLFIFSITSALGILLSTCIIPKTEINLLNWTFHALLYSLIIGGLLTIISVLFYREELQYLKNYIFNNGKKEKR